MTVDSEFGSQQRNISYIGPSLRKINEEEILIHWDGKKKRWVGHEECILVKF